VAPVVRHVLEGSIRRGLGKVATRRLWG
ncbi:conserved hypothetical protein, partial [Burkholderia mallei JHU]